MKRICITQLCSMCEWGKEPKRQLHVGDICTVTRETPDSMTTVYVTTPNGHERELCFLYKYEEVYENMTLADYKKQVVK